MPAGVSMMKERQSMKYEKPEVEVVKFEGIRCERCWNYFDEADIVDDICFRCADAIK